MPNRGIEAVPALGWWFRGVTLGLAVGISTNSDRVAGMPELRMEPADAQFLANPYPTYAALRSADDFGHDPKSEMSWVTRHADVAALLRDPACRRGGVQPDPRATRFPALSRYVFSSFMERDGVEHGKLRAIVAGSFTARRVDELRPVLERVAEDRLDAAVGTIDIIRDYAEPIALTAIGELLGIVEEDRSRLPQWSHSIVGAFEPDPSAEQLAASDQAAAEFAEYLGAVVKQRRRRPGRDLISALALGDAGDRLTTDEAIATCILLLNAGHEATVKAIGNAVLALAANPDQYAQLRGDGVRWRLVVDELLRYDPPLQLFHRWVTGDVAVRDHRVAPGTKLGLLLGAANRDPEVFAEPDRLDLSRTPNPHLSFGAGPHVCLGAPLARLELEVALSELSRRLPRLELDMARIRRRASLVFRGVEALRLVV